MDSTLAASWAAARRLSTHSCTADSDCGMWETCAKNATSGECAVAPKKCSGGCSDRGECVAINVNNWKPVTECAVNDPSCEAICRCYEGFGGRTCNATTQYMQWRQGVRREFIQGLSTVLTTDDVNLNSVATWTGSLSALTQDAYELSTDSIADIEIAAVSILSIATQVPSFTYESALGVLSAVDAASSAGAQTNASAAVDAVLAALDTFSDFAAAQRATGEASDGYWYDNFRLHSASFLASGNSSVDITVPSTGLEETSGIMATTLSLMAEEDSSGDEEVGLSVIATSAALYGELGSSLNTNPLRLKVTRSANRNTTVLIQLAHNAEVTFTPDESSPEMRFETNCTLGSNATIETFLCPVSGMEFVHNCTGIQGSILSVCPMLVPSCSVLNTTAGAEISQANATCTVLSYDTFSTTCQCTVPTSPTSGDRRRRLENAASESGALDIASASIYMGNEFTQTFDSSEGLLTAEGLQRVLIVIVMFGTLWGAGFFLIMTCTGRSKLMEPKHKLALQQIEDELKSAQASQQSRADICHYLTNYVVEVFPSVFTNKPFFGRVWGEIKRHHRYLKLFTASESRTGDKERILTAVELLSVQTMLMFLLALMYDVQAPSNDNSCDPHKNVDSCLSRRSPFDNTLSYCDWDGPPGVTTGHYCSYSEPTFTLQIVIFIGVVVALFTALIEYPIDCMMDLLSAPLEDDLKIRDQESTLTTFGRRVSNVARRMSAVAGNAVSAARTRLGGRKTVIGAAARRIPDSAGVAHKIASVSMSLIAASSQKSLRERELSQLRQFHLSGGQYSQYTGGRGDAASDSSDSDSSADAAVQTRPARKATSPRPPSATPQTLQAIQDAEDTSPATSNASVDVEIAMMRLTDQISCQRRLLKQDEIVVFDSQWGLMPSGAFKHGAPSLIPFLPDKPGALELISKEVAFAQSEAGKKVEKLKLATDQHTGLEILHLFIMDLLGRKTPAARIFETKAMEDFKHTTVVSKTAKRLAMLGLVSINGFFVYYAMLTGYRRGISWQRMYLLACVLQFVVEVILFETMECVWINCAIPALVGSEVRRVGDDVIEVVQHLCTGAKPDAELFLNAPDYLFVSTTVAKKFPDLMESVLVQTYFSHLPGEIAKIWNVGAVSPHNAYHRIRQASVLGTLIGMLQLMGTAPFFLHRMIVRFSQPLVFSALVLFWQLMVSNQTYVFIALGLLSAFGFYCAYMYYVDRNVTSTIRAVRPVRAEYESNTTPAAAPGSSSDSSSYSSSSGSSSDDEPRARAGSRRRKKHHKDKHSKKKSSSRKQKHDPLPTTPEPPNRGRATSYDLEMLNLPVLDANFDVVPNHRPFGSSKPSDSESSTSGRRAKRGREASSSKNKTSVKKGRTRPAESSQSEAAADNSELSSEDLPPSDLDKPSRSRSGSMKQKDRRSRGSHSKHQKNRTGSHKHSRKSRLEQRNRQRTESVESIPEEENEDDSSSCVEQISSKQSKTHKKQSNKQKQNQQITLYSSSDEAAAVVVLDEEQCYSISDSSSSSSDGSH